MGIAYAFFVFTIIFHNKRTPSRCIAVTCSEPRSRTLCIRPRAPRHLATATQLPYHVACVQTRLITVLGKCSNSKCYTPSSESSKGSDDGV
jgi:hypothetical protein